MLTRNFIILSILSWGLWANAGESFNSLVKSAAEAQCAQMIIEAHDRNIHSKSKTRPLFNDKKADALITKEMNKLHVDLKAKPALNNNNDDSDKRYDQVVSNVLKAAKKADPYFHRRCIRHYAIVYKSCSNAGDSAARCVAQQKAKRKGTLKTLWAQVRGKSITNIAQKD